MTTLTSQAILRRIIDGTAHVTGDWKVNYLLLTVTDSTHEASGDIVINNCHVWLYNINFHEEDVMVNWCDSERPLSMENTVNYKEAIRDCKNKKGIEQINRPNTLKDQKCTIFHVEHINMRKRSSTLLTHDKVSKTRRLILRTRDEQEALGHADRVREMNTVSNCWQT